ncbi:response regulator [Ferruginibacter sp.]
MEMITNIFSDSMTLFVLSAFNTGLLVVIIIAMIFILYGFYRANIAVYTNKMQAMNQQIEAMQQHLEYASREEANARADAKRSAAARDHLLTSLNHEIRTPMNGILGMAILLEETSLDPEQKDYIDTIISSGKILLNKVDEVIANDTLEQSKINRTISAAQQKNTDLVNCVEEVIETFAVKAAARSVELLYAIAHDVPQQVMADNKRLQQVLTNLAENIMEKGKQVFIGVNIIKHNSTGIAPVLGFTVAAKPFSDAAAALYSGNTLPESINENRTTAQWGLDICKKLVDEMGGQIRMSGEQGDGFIFSIPLQAVELLNNNSTGYSLKELEQKNVLVVNSNTTAAGILQDQLQQWKLQAQTAASGKEALQLAATQAFDLIIADMDLTDITGTDLAAQVKQQYPQLPFILLHAVNDDRYRQHAIAQEITALSKPIKQHVLFDNILSNLRQVKKAGLPQEVSVKKLSTEFSKAYPLRILIAEDNHVNQKWAIKILDKLGYQPDIADNGHIVLDMVGKTSYDLILMDVQMPEMDGLEATKMIRVCLSKQPVIIAMTANVMHGDRIACMQAGMDDYISKPVQLAELVNMLEKWALVIRDKKTAGIN